MGPAQTSVTPQHRRTVVGRGMRAPFFFLRFCCQSPKCGVRIRENLDYIQGAGFTAGDSLFSISGVSVSSVPSTITSMDQSGE